MIQGDKKVAEHLGVEVDGVAKEAAIKATKAELAEAEAAGLDPEVHRALKHPQVREAIEQEFSRAEAVKSEYGQALQHAQTFGLAAIHTVAPELSQVPPDQMEQALQVLAEIAPDRYQAVATTLQNVAALQQHQQQAEQHQKAVEQQQIATWAKGEDARLKTMGVEFTQENVNDIVAYAEDLGVSRETLGNAMLAHPILRSAEVQKMMADAAAYRKLKASPAKAAAKPIPPVQRPGTSQQRVSSNTASIENLSKQLANASGNKALRIGAEILSLKRSQNR